MITKLALMNFKQYRGEHVVTFSPGVNLIQGENDAGKSTLFHAISYALFSQTPTYGSTTSALVTRGERGMRVSVEFLDPRTGSLYRLTRGRNVEEKGGYFLLEKRTAGGWALVSSSHHGGRESDLRRTVASSIGLDKRTFLNVVYAPQKEFVRLVRGGADVKRDLDTILGITVAQTVADLLSEASRQLEVKLQKEEWLRRALDDRYATRGKLLAELRGYSSDLISKRREREALASKVKRLEQLAQLLSKILNHIALIEGALLDKQSYLALQSKLKSSLAVILQGFRSPSELEEAMKSLRGRSTEISSEVEALERSLDSARQALSKIERDYGYLVKVAGDRREVMDQGFCPKCGQLVDVAILSREVERLTRQLQRKQLELAEKRAEVSGLEERIKRSRLSLGEVERELSRLSAILKQANDVQRELSKVESEIANAESRLRGSLGALELIAQEAAPLLKEVDAGLPEGVSSLKLATVEQLRAARSMLESKVGLEYKSSLRDLSRLDEAIKERSALVLDRARELRRVLEEIQSYSEELRRLEEVKDKIRALALSEGVCSNLQEVLRNTMLRVLATKTYYWYTVLSPERSYSAVDFDPESYELLVQPTGSRDFYPVKAYSGGGVETLFALSMRLALAEVAGAHGVLMFDEPTDAASERTKEHMMEALYRASHRFRQILLITHHETGKELASSVYRVRYDPSKMSSTIEVVARTS